MSKADKIAAQISRADRAHEWAIADAQKAVACAAARDEVAFLKSLLPEETP